MASLEPNPNFRPNPERAIYVQGFLDQQLIDRLTPDIISLQHRSRDPITLYIDSLGGNTIAAEALLRLLTSPTQDYSGPCRLITVVTGRAASAAADLLSSGDYAIGYPETTLHYHGVRTSLANPLTAETASFLTETLKISNDKYAIALARRSIGRFIFRYLHLRSQFAVYRAEVGEAGLTDLDCFLALISRKLSENANSVIEQARIRNGRYAELLHRLSKSAFRQKRFHPGTRQAEREAIMLKGIIDFELKTNAGSAWTFQTGGGLAKLCDDFLLISEYLAPHQNDEIAHLCNRWADYFLTPTETAELTALPGQERSTITVERLKPHLQPLWFFFVALCHALQEGENELTALDALWLGLIDEVLGCTELPTLRLISEFRADGERPTAEGATAT